MLVLGVQAINFKQVFHQQQISFEIDSPCRRIKFKQNGKLMGEIKQIGSKLHFNAVDNSN